MDSASRYDDYWRGRDEVRTRARSRSRAFLALRLLEKVGMRPADSAAGGGPASMRLAAVRVGHLRFSGRQASM